MREVSCLTLTDPNQLADRIYIYIYRQAFPNIVFLICLVRRPIADWMGSNGAY